MEVLNHAWHPKIKKRSDFISRHWCFSEGMEQLFPKMFLLRLHVERGQFSALGDCSKDDSDPFLDNGN